MSTDVDIKDLTEIFAALAAPFPPDQVRTKPGGGGRQISYITDRMVQNRLDEVIGPWNWWDRYRETKDGICCTLTIRLPDGQELSKENGAGFEDMTAEDDSEKSGYSNSFKRAGVRFGIGRYLYRDGVPGFAQHLHGGQRPAGPGPARLPDPMDRLQPTDHPRPPERPQEPRREPQGQNGHQGHQGDGRADLDGIRKGGALFAWCRKREDAGEKGMLRRVSDYGKEKGFPDRMVQWSEAEVLETCLVIRSWGDGQ